MGRLEGDHIKRLITLTSDNIKRLSLYKNKFLHKMYSIKYTTEKENVNQIALRAYF